MPTTAGTGSEAQSYALITDPSSHMKMACGDKKAAFRVSILDPELTLSQPPTVTAVTGIDAVAHAVESFVCTKANPVSRMASRAAWEHLEPNFETVLREPNNLDARASMQMGAHLAGMAQPGAERLEIAAAARRRLALRRTTGGIRSAFAIHPELACRSIAAL